ncbi:MAG TPA: FGGY-family carbohydrate kinase [Actinomycetales bacterium]
MLGLPSLAVVGLELEHPVISDAGRDAGFTNEGGVDGRVRYLRNVVGLWMLQESLRTWRHEDGGPAGSQLGPLLAAAADLPDGGPVIDVDDPALLPAGDMPARVVAACRRSGQREPATRPQLVRCALDSLAAAFARTLAQAQHLSGRRVGVVDLVGGGALNDLLCRLTARACGLPVLAGPVEATAIGNVLVQARAHGSVTGDLDELRALVGRTQTVRRYEPVGPAARG